MLSGGYWAAMYRLRLTDQPTGIPPDVVFRIAPDAAMGAKELAVHRALADQGCPTPPIRLAGTLDTGEVWSVMDHVAGRSPLDGLNGLAALRQAPRLLRQLPDQLATVAAALHGLDPWPATDAVRAAAPTVVWDIADLLDHYAAAATALGLDDVAAGTGRLARRRPPAGPAVICHGDLHPFNLIIGDDATVTLIDWTGAIPAEPTYDLAFTSLLLANPPLDGPAPVRAAARRAGALLSRRFISRYRTLRPDTDLDSLDWYRALHSARLLIEAETIATRPGNAAANHPFAALTPIARATLAAA